MHATKRGVLLHETSRRVHLLHAASRRVHLLHAAASRRVHLLHAASRWVRLRHAASPGVHLHATRPGMRLHATRPCRACRARRSGPGMHLHAATRPCRNRESGGLVTSFREHRSRDVLVAALLPVDTLLRGATAPTRRFLGRRPLLPRRHAERRCVSVKSCLIKPSDDLHNNSSSLTHDGGALRSPHIFTRRSTYTYTKRQTDFHNLLKKLLTEACNTRGLSPPSSRLPRSLGTQDGKHFFGGNVLVLHHLVGRPGDVEVDDV